MLKYRCCTVSTPVRIPYDHRFWILTHFSDIPSTSHTYPSASAVTIYYDKTAASLAFCVTLARGSSRLQNESMMLQRGPIRTSSTE